MKNIGYDEKSVAVVFFHPFQRGPYILFETACVLSAGWPFLLPISTLKTPFHSLLPTTPTRPGHGCDWTLHKWYLTDGALEQLNMAYHLLADLEHSTYIIELPAVIGCGKDGEEFTFIEKLVSVLDHLMRTTDKVKLVLLQKLVYHLLPENARDAPLKVGIPVVSSFRGVWP